MNKVLRNLSVYCIAFLSSLLNISSSDVLSINNDSLLNCDDCCSSSICENEHNHNEVEGKPIIGLPSTLSFNRAMATSSSGYGEVTVKANYEPEGCLSDTIWESSNPSVVRIEVDSNDSSIATLVCLSPFEGEITITARSFYFENISYSCKATYKDNFEITPLVNEVELTGTRSKSCPGMSSYSFSYDNQVLLTSLYEMSEDVPVSYSVSGSGVVISGNYIRMNSAVNSSSIELTITPEGHEDKALTIPVYASYTTNNGSHSYTRTVYKSAYDTSTTWGTWGNWTTTKEPTCTATGTKKRTRTGTYYHYKTEYKYKCSYCGDIYYSGGTRSTKTTTDTEEESIAALGHDYVESLKSASVGATCTSSGKKAVYTHKCSRCGDSYETGGETIAALGHNYSGYYCLYDKTKLTYVSGMSGASTYKCSKCNSNFTFSSGTSSSYYQKCSRCSTYKYVAGKA